MVTDPNRVYFSVPRELALLIDSLIVAATVQKNSLALDVLAGAGPVEWTQEMRDDLVKALQAEADAFTEFGENLVWHRGD